ncbi:MAG: hypothetical protein IJT35_05515 [Paludibacteraceae bacterium]|nr:hypothetical protein [Paludibacteraceae bacterium]
MKKLLVLWVAAVCCTVTFAQSSQIATLNHQGQIKTYYGAQALVDAHNDAANGDVITLSIGSFNGVDITKAVTIRGAGMGMSTTEDALPTIINSDFTIDVPSSTTANLVMEGIFHDGYISYKQATRPMFIKCRFYDFITFQTGSQLTDATFMHCKFSWIAELIGSGSIINSVSLKYILKGFSATNCIFMSDFGENITNSTLTNCIIGAENPIAYSNYVNHCIVFAPKIYYKYFDGETILDDLPVSATNQIVERDSIFETFDFTYYESDEESLSDTEWFKLSEKGKTYLGDDEKEVGIYGGKMPFDPRTTTPQITKCNVAAKSTADGKLSVDIEVSGIE